MAGAGAAPLGVGEGSVCGDSKGVMLGVVVGGLEGQRGVARAGAAPLGVGKGSVCGDSKGVMVEGLEGGECSVWGRVVPPRLELVKAVSVGDERERRRGGGGG